MSFSEQNILERRDENDLFQTLLPNQGSDLFPGNKQAIVASQLLPISPHHDRNILAWKVIVKKKRKREKAKEQRQGSQARQLPVRHENLVTSYFAVKFLLS
jgi:hypothetical protein